MRAVLVPGALALLPEYAGLQDPLPELRAACLAAVAWAGEDGPVRVVGTPQGRRVGEALVAAVGFETVASATSSTTGGRSSATSSTTGGRSSATSSTTGSVVEEGALAPVSKPLVVVANGSAKRATTSPGYVDDRALGFDADLGERLRTGDLTGIGHDLARELWADTVALDELAAILPAGCGATIDLETDPYGVQYWVARWEW